MEKNLNKYIEGVSHLVADVIIHWNGRSTLDARSKRMSIGNDEFEVPGYPKRDAEYTGKNTCLVQNVRKRCNCRKNMHTSNIATYHKGCVEHQEVVEKFNI